MADKRRIDEIKERLNEATPWPWGVGYVYENNDVVDIISTNDETHGVEIGQINNIKDQIVIANAPTDIAYLLKVIEVYEEALNFYANNCAVWDSGNPARKALQKAKELE